MREGGASATALTTPKNPPSALIALNRSNVLMLWL